MNNIKSGWFGNPANRNTFSTASEHFSVALSQQYKDTL